MIEAILNYTFMQNALIAAILASVVTGIIGTIAIEKKLISMSGGIAHGSFGCIGLGYLLGFEPIWGGFVFAIGSSALISRFSQNKRIKADTLTGIMWSFGMALGILFISLRPGYMPDMTSYLFGDILSISNTAIISMAIFTGIIVLVYALVYNYLIAYLFDEEFARAKGINVRLIRAIVYLIIPIGIIVLIRVVGIILTIALLTTPTSIAKVFTKSFGKVVTASIFISMFFCILGLAVSYYINIPSGVCIIVIMTLVYLVIMFVNKAIQHKIHEKRVHDGRDSNKEKALR